jgi:hypothetical protein
MMMTRKRKRKRKRKTRLESTIPSESVARHPRASPKKKTEKRKMMVLF